MVKGRHVSGPQDDSADMQQEQRQQKGTRGSGGKGLGGKGIGRPERMQWQHSQNKSEGAEHYNTPKPASAGLTDARDERPAQPGSQVAQDTDPTKSPVHANINADPAQHSDGQTLTPVIAAAAARDARHSSQAAVNEQLSAGTGDLDTTGQFYGQSRAQEQAGADEVDAAQILAGLAGGDAAAPETSAPQPMPMQQLTPAAAAAGAYGYGGLGGVDYNAMLYPQHYPLPAQYPAAAWPQLLQDQQGAIGYPPAPKHSGTGGGSKAGTEYYRQKLAEILREASRVHELPHWDVHVSHRPKNGKPDAVYIAPDGTRYKSRAILRDALDLKPGPGARRAKVLQQQQLQAAMAATAAANAAAAAAAVGGDPTQNTGALGTTSGLGGMGLVQPAATAVSGSAPAAASFTTDQVPNAGASAAAAAAAAAAGMQQQAGPANSAAGSGPAWYEKVLQLTQTVVDSLEPAMRGQYKVIHILRCPVITGYVVEYCRRTTKGAIRNQLSGRVTADGNITCGCTSRCNWQADIPSSMFEEHSGSTVRRPAQFIYIIGPQNSAGEILENYNITLKELLALVNSGTSGTSGANTSSESAVCVFTPSKRCRHCMSCSEPGGPENGPLLECAGCPLAYHRRCLGIEGVVPDGARWYCPYCLQACRDPPGYRDGHLHRMCQQAVLTTRQIPKPPVVRQHYSGARALDQMSVPPPPPPLPGQHKPAYSTADTAVSTAATSQQQQQQHKQPAVSSLSTGSAAAADSAAGAAAAGSADSKPGSSAAVAGLGVKLEADDGNQHPLTIPAELDTDLNSQQVETQSKQRQSGLQDGAAGQQLGAQPRSLSPAAAAAAEQEAAAIAAAAAAEEEKGPHQQQRKYVRKYMRKKGVTAAGLAASAAAPKQEEEPAIPVGGDPLEPRYCICNNVAYGEMVQCDNKCCPIEWFHYACVGIREHPKGVWYCTTQACSEQMQQGGDLAAVEAATTAAAVKLGEGASMPPEPAAPAAGVEHQAAASSQQAAGKPILDGSLARDAEQVLPAASAGMDVDQGTASGYAAAAAGETLPSQEVIELLSDDDVDDADDEHVVLPSPASLKAPAAIPDQEMMALHESPEPDAQVLMPGRHSKPGAATRQQQSAGAAPPLAAGNVKPRSRPITVELVNPAQSIQLLPSAAAAAGKAMVEQQPLHAGAAAGDGSSAVMEQQGTVMKPAADVQPPQGATIAGQAGAPVSTAANAQLQRMQQWQWLQAWQTNRALSAAMQQQQPTSSAADTATHMQLNSSQQQVTRRTSSGNAAASGASAPTYKLNAPKPRLPAAARAAAAAAAGGGESAATAKDSKETSATAAVSSGSGGAGAASPGSFKRRTPQDMRRMVVRNLHALIGPYTEAAWQEFVKRGTTRGAQPSQWQCEAFMAEVLGDKGGPNAALWPGADELKPEGVMGYLARVIEWASGVSLTPEQVNDCFVAGEHVWKVNDDKLALLGLYPWNWTLPLNPQQVATTSSKPSREELQPVTTAAVAAAAAKLVSAMTNKSKPASPAPTAAALGAAAPAPSGTTQYEPQTPSVSAPAPMQQPVSSAAMQQQFAAPPGSIAPAAVHPSTSSGSAGAVPAVPAVPAVIPSPVVPVAVKSAGVAAVIPSASYVSAATAIPGLPLITPGVPAAAGAFSHMLQRLVHPGARPSLAVAQQSGQWVAPVAHAPPAAEAVTGGLAQGMGVKVLQGLSAQAATSTPMAVPVVAAKRPAVAPTSAVPVVIRPNLAARLVPTSSSPADADSQGAALVAALQRAGASAKGATAAATAVGLLPLQQTSTAGAARPIKLEPQQQEAAAAVGPGSAVVAARDKVDGVYPQQVDPLAARAAARAAVAARQQQLLAQQRRPAGRDTISTKGQPVGDAGGAATPHDGAAAAADVEEAPMEQDHPETAVDPDLAPAADGLDAAGGADAGSLDTAGLRSEQTQLPTAAAAADNVTDSRPSPAKLVAKPVEVKRCIARQLRLLSPQADKEYQAICDSTSKKLKEHLTSADLDVFFRKVIGPELGSTALPWPAEELRLGSMEEGAAVYMARLLSACSGKVISSEVYKRCVTRQGIRWVLMEAEFRNIGLAPWTWSIPLHLQVPAASDLSVSLSVAQAAAKAGQAASDAQKQDLTSHAQGPVAASAGDPSEQTLVSSGGTQSISQTQQRDSAGDADNALQAAAAGASTWGQPPPARPPSKDAHVQKLRELNLLMKRKYSLDQEDEEDPLVKTRREIEAVDLVVTSFLLVQQLRQQESALAADLNKLAGVRDLQKDVIAAQARLHADMALKEQQYQQELQEMQRQQQEFMAPGLWDPTGGDLTSENDSGMESDSGSVMS